MLRPSLLFSGSALLGLLSWLCLSGECGWLISSRQGRGSATEVSLEAGELSLPSSLSLSSAQVDVRHELVWLTQSIEQEPGNAQLYLQRAQYFWDQSQADSWALPEAGQAAAVDRLMRSALRDLDIAIALDPYLPEAYLLKARIQHEYFGELEQALATLSPLDRIAYRNPQLHLMRSRIWVEQGHLESGFDVAHLAIELAKQNQNIADLFDAYIHRGLMWASICDFQLAVADFSRAIELQPQRAEGYYHRGMARAYQGEDTVGAVSDLGSALALWRAAGTGSPELLEYVEAVRMELLR